MRDLGPRVREAVQRFWQIRGMQANRQGRETGERDRGSRADVTGGQQMNGFEELVRDLLLETGIPESAIHFRKCIELPGYFRAEKQWDLLVVVKDQLLAAIEFKSQVGSFGNNFNNRTEEAIGTASDLWTAYREGAFQPSARPWLGYLMLLESAQGSMRPIKPAEPHFKVFEEFRGASYAKRYELLMLRLLRERLYDGTCLLLSSKEEGPAGDYTEPCAELAFQNFILPLLVQAKMFIAKG
ncbi:MAG: PaeR7I family type II restriction endonuclease [FCB group bacterium]|jgi:hypothetical protein|nr:PaeR7I family type II restriction endonuclease [FCB group bacterium]